MNYKTLSLLLLAVISQQARADASPYSQEGINESQREAQEAIDRANLHQQQRDAANELKQQQNQSAEQRVKDARKELEESKVVGEGDRIGKAGGGTRLSPGYLERVKNAEQALKDAQAGKVN